MTAVIAAPGSPTGTAGQSRQAPEAAHRSPLSFLVLILGAQIALALRPGLNKNAFDDEGLYIYFGHLEIHHLTEGVRVSGSPGAYFSGTPWLYPPLAAIGDTVGGLQGARAVSLLFALVATIGTYGVGKELFGRHAGLIGAAAFAVNGSVIFQSHLATYDSMAMSLIALSTWLTVFIIRHDRPQYLAGVASLLTIAFLAKYAAAVYVPIVALLLIAAGWRTRRWKTLWQAAAVMVGTATLAVLVIELWGQDLVTGITFTTTGRKALAPAPRADLVEDIVLWAGAWLVLALLAAILRPHEWRVTSVLLLASVVGPLEQIRIGESLSLSKHVAFGLVFAAPLIGDLLSRLIDHRRSLGWTATAATVILLLLSGLHYSSQFLTRWDDDRALVPVLRQDIAADPGQPILGDQPAAQRYELRAVTTPDMWSDTYSFRYRGQVNQKAYLAAIDQTYFGVIYLDSTTVYGQEIEAYLRTGRAPYRQSATAIRYLHGHPNGEWRIYTRSSAPAQSR